MLIDNVKIQLKAGDGGNGCVAFHREKYVAQGGPDGGDGGNGGNIYFKIVEGTNTLLDYKYHRKFAAKNGDNGMTSKFHGKTGEDLYLPVPPGTVIKDVETGLVIKDMTNCEPFMICKGGRGGWGNQHFATPTRQIPRFAKNGILGESKEIMLELKMIADVGLIGLPNAGKSSILSVISAATPKIGDYKFTTLSPNLGVIKMGEDGKGFVAADIPGLIEGASDGAGLGHEFLRHVDRCRLLIHVVDISGYDGDPVENIKLINNELKKYSPELADRPQIIAANKYDIVDETVTNLKEFEDYAKECGYDFVYLSAATTYNISKLVSAVWNRLQELPDVKIYDTEYVKPEVIDDKKDHTVEIRNENGIYMVEGDWLYRLMGTINFDDTDSLTYFQRVLLKSGVIEALEEHGVVDGDTVSIYDFEFDFIK